MKTAVLAALVLMSGASFALGAVVDATGGLVRTLDRMTGTIADYDLAAGQSQALGHLNVTLDACRYPDDLPTGEAFAHVTIIDLETATPVFQGWMIASSPALSALDHPRYDVWVLRCDVPESTVAAEGSGG